MGGTKIDVYHKWVDTLVLSRKGWSHPQVSDSKHILVESVGEIIEKVEHIGQKWVDTDN